MRKNQSYYTKRAIVLSSLTYILIFLWLINNEIASPIPEAEEGIVIDFTEPIPEEQEEKKWEELDENDENLSPEERQNIAVNKALQGEKTSNPYDYSEVETPDEEYKANLVKQVISEQKYKDIFERPQIDNKEETEAINEEEEELPRQIKNTSVYSGATYIEYDLSHNRHHTQLPIPTYKCENSGKVIFSITVKPNGRISHFEMLPSSSPDECLRKAALNSLKRTRFNIDNKAPNPQHGTIRYLFESQ